MSAKPLTTRLFLCAGLFLISILSKAQLTPQFSATPLAGCAPLVVHFTDQSAAANQWQWDLGNGTTSVLQNPSAVYFNPGTYSVKLVVKNAAGTKDSLTKTNYITVYAAPTVDFSAANTNGCFPLPVQFTDGSVPGSGNVTGWLWDFGDGNSSTQQNPVHTYTAFGTFNVSLQVINSNGCSTTLTKTNYIHINTGVHAQFTNNTPSGCTAPETINFTNQSTGTGTVTYQWLFGDGGTSSATSPSHTYATAGTYTVQLIVTNSTGCADTSTHTNAIQIGMVHAAFTLPATVCVNTAFSFTNTSAPTPASVNWTFGDGTSSTQINPIKTYTVAGIYTVKLVSNFGGCIDSMSKQVSVLPKPTAAFGGSPVISCSVPFTVNFSDSSTGSVNTQWFFGDGTASAGSNPSHTYTTAGDYDVTVVATNANGCTDTLKKTAFVQIHLPVAVIDNLPQQGCAPFSWTFHSTVTSIEPVASYQWNFGDGSTSTAATPTHIFAAGIYDIQLIITTATGCTDTVVVPQGIKSSVKPVPAFGANPRDVCAHIPVNFSDSSTGTITNWTWYFGDGGTDNAQNPTHTYSDTGYFNVTLIVGNNGCMDTVVYQNYIHIKPPIAAFTFNNDCINKYTRTFTDHSIGADTWSWDFGDGSTSTQQSPVHTYASVGTYTITLTVTNFSTGCDFTTTKTVTIADEHAAFTAAQTEVCKNTSIDFTATSPHNPPAITAYNWDFGDGTTGTGSTPSHVYTHAGSYSVRLVITDVNGCTDTLLRSQYIRVNGPTVNFSSTVPGSCLQTTINFNDNSSTDGNHAIQSWHWYYGDGTDEILTAPPFAHAYATAGIYDVTLVITDSFGCSDSLTKSHMLTISTPVAAFATVDTASCPGKSIAFTNSSTGPGLVSHWDFGDGGSSNSATPSHTYSANGYYSVTLTVTDTYGCVSTLTKPQYIHIVTPFADFSTSDSVSTCPPLIVQFTNNSQNMQTFHWDFGDGNVSSAQDPTHFYNVAGSYTATLSITSPGGCTSVKTMHIRVNGPSGSFSYSPLTGCSPLTVHFTSSTLSRASFIWDFNDGNTLPTTDSILSHTYTIPGNYVPKMILKDVAGCTVSITGPDTIKVNGAAASFVADTLLRCTAGPVSFTNTSVSNDAISSYLWNFGDGSTSTTVSPQHNYSAPGLYTPTLTVHTVSGCTSTASQPVPVKVVKTPVISVTQSNSACVPLRMNLVGNLLNADTSAINWNWTFNDGSVKTGQHLNGLLFPNAGQYSAQLIATNSSGCSDTASAQFEAYGLPQINAGVNINICAGTGRTISASGGQSYTWSPAAGLSCVHCASPVATPDSARTYTVVGTSVHGCINADSLKVTVTYPFRITHTPGDTLCKGQTTSLAVSGADHYSWSPSTGLNSTTAPMVTATPSSTTNYTVVGFDNVGCFTDTAHFTVKVYPVPTVTAGIDKTVNVGQTVLLTPVFSPDVTNVIWSPTVGITGNDYPSISVKPTTDMQYKVQVRNAGGCTAEATVNIFVLCNGANVFIPNTFSPNGDGVNEIFYPRGTGLFTIKQARIYNRWGQEVYEKYGFNANDAKAGWDGTFKGAMLPADVYVYMFEIVCDNNTTLVYKGNVALIK